MPLFNIALLGAGSHIAKGLIYSFLGQTGDALTLFTRDPEPVERFLVSIGQRAGERCRIMRGYDAFLSGQYDAVINCIGVGSPRKLRNHTDWFMVTERFDNLVLEYLGVHPGAAYVCFSSGAVYGREASDAVGERTVNAICPNHIRPSDYYAVAKLNAEAKHRAHEGLKIVDLRIFSYFSRFADLDSGYFITDALSSVVNRTVLKTDSLDMVRDYVHPDDLASLVRKCLAAGSLNDAFDVMSAAPVGKFTLLDHLAGTCGLRYEVVERFERTSPNGQANIYFSRYNRASTVGHCPHYTSLETICGEAERLLAGRVS